MHQQKKKCRKCKQKKDTCLFYQCASSADKRSDICIECYRLSTESSEASIRKNRKRWELTIRSEVIKRYGGICECCGANQLEFLTVCPKRRTKHRTSRTPIHYWLKSRGFPPGYLVLCHNCLRAESLYGCCPHCKTPMI